MSDANKGQSNSFLRLEDVMRRVGIKRSLIYKLMSEGKFPKACRIGRASVWSEREIDTFVEQALLAR